MQSKKLKSTPGAGSARYAHLLANLRMFVVQDFPYLVFYLEQDSYIDILRILHARRDLPVALGKTSG